MKKYMFLANIEDNYEEDIIIDLIDNLYKHIAEEQNVSNALDFIHNIHLHLEKEYKHRYIDN